jgi:hypothetical protein
MLDAQQRSVEIAEFLELDGKLARLITYAPTKLLVLHRLGGPNQAASLQLPGHDLQIERSLVDAATEKLLRLLVGAVEERLGKRSEKLVFGAGSQLTLVEYRKKARDFLFVVGILKGESGALNDALEQTWDFSQGPSVIIMGSGPLERIIHARLHDFGTEAGMVRQLAPGGKKCFPASQVERIVVPVAQEPEQARVIELALRRRRPNFLGAVWVSFAGESIPSFLIQCSNDAEPEKAMGKASRWIFERLDGRVYFGQRRRVKITERVKRVGHFPYDPRLQAQTNPLGGR